MRRDRREFIRTQHPDRGGDPAAFAEGLSRFDALVCAAEPDRPGRGLNEPGQRRPVTVVRRPHGLGGWVRHLSHQILVATGRARRSPPVR